MLNLLLPIIRNRNNFHYEFRLVTIPVALTTRTSSGQTSASNSATSMINEGTSSIGPVTSATQTQAKSSSASGLRISRKLVLLGVVFWGSCVR